MHPIAANVAERVAERKREVMIMPWSLWCAFRIQDRRWLATQQQLT
jgi:hypothetical protein